MSTAMAVGVGVLTLSAIAGIVTMSIAYAMQIENEPPTREPTPQPTEPVPTGPPPTLRLPRNVIPENYTIFLMPHFYPQLTNETTQSFLFKGNSTVTLRCLNRTKSIFLHSKDLQIIDVTLRHLGRNRILKTSKEVNDSTNFFEVRLVEDDYLEENDTYSLFVKFSGNMLNDLSGFYTSQYDVQEGNGTR